MRELIQKLNNVTRVILSVFFSLLLLALCQLPLRLVLLIAAEWLAATTRVRWVLILIYGEKASAFPSYQSFLLLRLTCVTCSPLNQSEERRD